MRGPSDSTRPRGAAWTRIGGLTGPLLLWAAAACCQPTPPAVGPQGVIVLHRSSYWRVMYSWGHPQAKTPQGYAEIKPRRRYRGCECQGEQFRFLDTYPPAGWTEPQFQDWRWSRRPFQRNVNHGEVQPGGGRGESNKLTQISLRGKFTVTDPARVERLRLSLAYRGGVVVHLNGREIARQYMPTGPIEPAQPARLYPRKAYLKDNGKLVHWWRDKQIAQEEHYPLRVRGLENLAIRPGLLRKGTNVLAVEIHAACFPPECMKLGAAWATAGLIDVCLRADAPHGLVPNVVRPRGLQVWNASLLEEVHDVDYGDPHEALRPVRLAVARNGFCTGRVVVSSDRPIRRLSAAIGELAGPGGSRITAQALRVRYGVFDSRWRGRWGGLGLWTYEGVKNLRAEVAALDSPPAEVPVREALLHGSAARAREAEGLPPLVHGAVQPVWVTARIGPEAAAGDYRGVLTITLAGHEPLSVPVHLRVCDWSLPRPRDFASFMGIVQSPEGVGLHYRLPLWSNRHWQRIAQSFDLIRQLGGDVLFIPLTAESQYGNSQSMVLWVRGDADAYSPDLGRVSRYVDVAVQHMGRPEFVVLGVWDSCGRGGARGTRREYPRISVLDRKTGRVVTEDGPPHGTPEAVTFWRPVLTQVRRILERRGLGGTALLGFGSDALPGMGVVTAFHNILPEAGWQATRHLPAPKAGLRYDKGTVPLDCQTNILGAWGNHDPACRRVYGWREPAARTWMLRPLNDSSPLAMVRVACEQVLLAGRRGQGQIGADFWPFDRGDGRTSPTVYGRFPPTNEGAAGMFLGKLLYPAPDGPVPTLRYEVIRENLQECEARIFLERLLTERPCRLGERLAETCQDLLDERTRWHRMQQVALAGNLTFSRSDWQGRSARLYEAAAEAARFISASSSGAPRAARAP